MSEKRPPCAGLWNTPMVHVNGEVTTCCLDEHLVNSVGNLCRKPLHEIWNGETMNKWRIAHIEGRFSDSGPLCTKCNWRSAGGYPKEKAEQWLSQLRAKRRNK
jgi:hypothetical protein